jgi:hypothetical protein
MTHIVFNLVPSTMFRPMSKRWAGVLQAAAVTRNLKKGGYIESSMYVLFSLHFEAF